MKVWSSPYNTVIWMHSDLEVIFTSKLHVHAKLSILYFHELIYVSLGKYYLIDLSSCSDYN